MVLSDSGAGDDALEVFAAWLSRREEGEPAAFDELVRRYPSLATELGQLEATWKRLASASDPSRSAESLHERIKSRFGEESVPDVSLRAHETGEGREEFPSALIAQLTTRNAGFGRYQIRGEVARGGMGAILKIWDEDLRRHLAMKVILGQAQARSSGATPPVAASKVARFLEEAQVTGQLDHPGIVPVHELGLDPEGRLYFTMKLVKGRSLKEVFDLVAGEKEGWTQTKVLGVLQKVCEAMAYAHDKGVIHRDLKPANVMVGKFGEVHVMDWGLARIVNQPDPKDIGVREEPPSTVMVRSERGDRREEPKESLLYTMDGDVVGTPAYMPPEQAAGRINEVGPHSDVYSLGAMLYHLLAGHPPYCPTDAKLDHYAVLDRVRQSPPTPITKIAPDTPTELVAVCEKAMSRDWKQRYRDMSEMAEDLSAYLENRVVRAYEAGPWAEARKWVRRNRSLAAAMATAFLLAIGGFSWVSLVQSHAREQIEKKNLVLAAATNSAQENEQLATQKTNDVLSLSAIQDLKELEDRADALWPAYPDDLPKLEAWLADARLLIEGRPADESTGLGRRPSLEDYEAKLSGLRQHARPRSCEQIEADRTAAPNLAELDRLRARLTWIRRMLGEERWPSEAEAEAELASETLPTDARGLHALTWPLVNTETTEIQYGDELRGLLLARRAVAAAKEPERIWTHEVLAWALFRCGRFDDALFEEQHAVDEVLAALKPDSPLRFSHALDLKKLQEFIAQWKSDDGRSQQEQDAMKLGARIVEIEHSMGERRTYDFDNSQDRWWHAQLSKLVTDLQLFKDEKHGGLFSSGSSVKHGWGIVARAGFARTIGECSVSGAEAKTRWDEAIAAIAASPKYKGLKLSPQLGLLPIGLDPQSGLWEFAHLQSGDPAQRGSDGKLMLNGAMGIVFVLIPSCTFWMGAQRKEPNERNYDSHAIDDELPVTEVKLDAYFISKYEMTQGQWERFVGRNPSFFNQDGYIPYWNRSGKSWNELHPVEQVSWNECAEVLMRLGLVLPTEAQWEHGCRGSTSTVYWSGDDAATLVDVGNINDQYANGHGGETWVVRHEAWDDGNTCTAEVGSYRPNDLGLYDTHGNVWEWCKDRFGRSPGFAPGDGERQVSVSEYRVARGGSFCNEASAARSAMRLASPSGHHGDSVGVRPARRVFP